MPGTKSKCPVKAHKNHSGEGKMCYALTTVLHQRHALRKLIELHLKWIKWVYFCMNTTLINVTASVFKKKTSFNVSNSPYQGKGKNTGL